MTEEFDVEIEKQEVSKINFNTFNPLKVPFQKRAIYAINKGITYKGTQIVLFSGSMGSGKTLTACQLIWQELLENPNANIGIGRLDLKRLKETLLLDLLKHIPEELEEGVDYKFNKSEGVLTLSSGARLTCFSWADKNMERFKGQSFSMFVIDEATENDENIFNIINARLGRSKQFKKKLFLLLTNPDEPDHWLAKRVINKAGWVDGKKREAADGFYNNNIHVFYSLTKDNPEIDEEYLNNLLAINHPKWIERNLEGKWVSFGGNGVYFAYTEDTHYIKQDYTINTKYPIYVSFDFNVALNKPMSVVLSQYINDTFHFFEESIIQGSNTSKTLDDMYSRGLFNYNVEYIINGDAAGWSKGSATNGFSDYDVIDHFLKKLKLDGKLRYKIFVPASNPEVKVRHNTVNAYLKNGLNQSRIYVYKNCPTLNEGFKLTKLKNGSAYVEDDSKSYQHVTTAAGYNICSNTMSDIKSKVLKF